MTWLFTAPWLELRLTPPPAVTLLDTPATDEMVAVVPAVTVVLTAPVAVTPTGPVALIEPLTGPLAVSETLLCEVIARDISLE